MRFQKPAQPIPTRDVHPVTAQCPVASPRMHKFETVQQNDEGVSTFARGREQRMLDFFR